MGFEFKTQHLWGMFFEFEADIMTPANIDTKYQYVREQKRFKLDCACFISNKALSF